MPLIPLHDDKNKIPFFALFYYIYDSGALVEVEDAELDTANGNGAAARY
jgi:hypothetical protein